MYNGQPRLSFCLDSIKIRFLSAIKRRERAEPSIVSSTTWARAPGEGTAQPRVVRAAVARQRLGGSRTSDGAKFSLLCAIFLTPCHLLSSPGTWARAPWRKRRTPWELERRRTEHEHHSGRSHIHVSHSLCPSIPPLAGHGPRRVHRPGRVQRVPRAPPPPAATGPPTSALPSRSTNPTATAASPPPRRASGRDAATAAAE